MVDDRIRVDWNKCDLCLRCAEACPSGAIEQVGRYVSKEELMVEIEKDALFYKNSGGGVTFSGGEPLAQWEFVREVCKVCKDKGTHVALDTTGYAQWDVMNKVLDYVDLVLYDIKHSDPLVHKEATGVTNEVILHNLEQTAKKVRTWLRVPVIPNFNDSESFIEEVAKFSLKLPVERVSLLPYHSWGQQKYERLGRKYPLEGLSPPSVDRLEAYKQIIESYGLKVVIGS